MVQEDFLAEVGAVYVHVDLGGVDALVAQHLLNGTQVGTAFEEMRGEGVAEGVRRHRGAYVGGDAQHAYDVEDGDARECRATAEAEEDEVLMARLGRDGVAVDEPGIEFVDGTL